VDDACRRSVRAAVCSRCDASARLRGGVLHLPQMKLPRRYGNIYRIETTRPDGR
jgi:hypothetical protein